MALIVEDGSIVVGADSYDTLENLAAYAVSMGLSFPITGSAEIIAAAEAAARRATSWLDGAYRSKFVGYRRMGRAQAREFPRQGAYSTVPPYNTIAINEIPYELKQAEALVAAQELASPNSMTPVVNMAQQIKSVSVEGAVSVSYLTPQGPQSSVPVLTALDGILAPLLRDDVAMEGSSVLFGSSERA